MPAVPDGLGDLPSGWRFRMIKSPADIDFHGAAVFGADGALYGQAWDSEPKRAQRRAIGEAVERSALMAPAISASRTGSYDELRPNAIDLADVVRFAPDQLADPALKRYRWTPATSVTWRQFWRTCPDGEPCWVPVELCSTGGPAGHVQLRPASSTGAACAPTRELALRHAVAECVERHVIAESVYAGEVAAEMSLAALGIEAEFESLSRAGLRLRIGMLPERFGIQVAIAALCSDRPHQPAASFGAAGGTDVAGACRAAALEAIQTYHFAWQVLARGGEALVPRDARTRALWWARNGTGLDSVFIGQGAYGPPARRVEQPPDSDRLLHLLTDEGHGAALADITPAWATPRFTAVRVVLPSLLELRADERFPYLFAPRFSHVVEQFRRRRDGRYERPALVPHPFF